MAKGNLNDWLSVWCHFFYTTKSTYCFLVFQKSSQIMSQLNCVWLDACDLIGDLRGERQSSWQQMALKCCQQAYCRLQGEELWRKCLSLEPNHNTLHHAAVGATAPGTLKGLKGCCLHRGYETMRSKGGASGRQHQPCPLRTLSQFIWGIMRVWEREIQEH
jgi:hypothetical protein